MLMATVFGPQQIRPALGSASAGLLAAPSLNLGVVAG
jgi:hypothetical protein